MNLGCYKWLCLKRLLWKDFTPFDNPTLFFVTSMDLHVSVEKRNLNYTLILVGGKPKRRHLITDLNARQVLKWWIVFLADILWIRCIGQFKILCLMVFVFTLKFWLTKPKNIDIFDIFRKTPVESLLKIMTAMFDVY